MATVFLNESVLAGDEEEVEKGGSSAARPEKLSCHVSQWWQCSQPSIAADLSHNSAHFRARALEEHLEDGEAVLPAGVLQPLLPEPEHGQLSRRLSQQSVRGRLSWGSAQPG